MGLHGRIFALVLLMLVGLGGTNLLFFYTSARDKAESDVTERLLMAERSFVDLLDNRQRELISSVNAVVNDWGLRQAIGQQDRQTARDVLVNHSTRVDADIALFIDRDRQVFAATQAVAGLPQNVQGLLDRAPESAHLIAAIGDRYYQLVIDDVKAPVHLGWLAMGFLIDDPLAERLSLLSDVEVSFVHDWAGTLDVFASSLDQGDRALAAAEPHPDPSARFWTVSGDGFEDLVLHHGLDPDRPGMQVALQRSLSAPLAEFRSWWWSLATIFSFVTAAGLALAWFFSRGITQPLNHLLAAIENMEAGNYSTRLKVERSDEIGSLSRSFIRMQRAIADREEEIRYRADHDLTTNVLNRNGFLDALGERIETAGDAHSALAVVCLRLNHFQQIVDALGHNWGDRLLELVAARLGATFTDSVLAHVNSDEFFLSFPAQDPTSVYGIGEQVHGCLAGEFQIRGISLTLTGNVGLSVFPDHAVDGQTLLRKASVALNEAIEHHRRTVVYDPTLDQNSVKRLTLMSELPKAIKHGQLELHYQPKIRCGGEAPVVEGVECLVRWQHPELGFIPPDEFISLAEKTGYIVELTRHVLDQALNQCADWRRRGINLSVSVNISAVDLRQGWLVTHVQEQLESYGLPASVLCLEITESAAMEDPDSALRRLTALRELGVRLSIDDYGTGYSSLAQLKKLPVQELKIDKSFVLDLDRSEDDQTIVRSTIELAHSIGLEVVGEGVESARILWQLREWQLDWAQGFHISRPLPLAALEAWLKETPYQVRGIPAAVATGATH
ncbi:MAG: putative bifunctional diguanylate cyclase/phosphodiesterase [Pseudomonadales bacterium]